MPDSNPAKDDISPSLKLPRTREFRTYSPDFRIYVPDFSLQPEAVGAVMEVTKWLKPPV